MLGRRLIGFLSSYYWIHRSRCSSSTKFSSISPGCLLWAFQRNLCDRNEFALRFSQRRTFHTENRTAFIAWDSWSSMHSSLSGGWILIMEWVSIIERAGIPWFSRVINEWIRRVSCNANPDFWGDFTAFRIFNLEVYLSVELENAPFPYFTRGCVAFRCNNRIQFGADPKVISKLTNPGTVQNKSLSRLFSVSLIGDHTFSKTSYHAELAKTMRISHFLCILSTSNLLYSLLQCWTNDTRSQRSFWGVSTIRLK